MMKITKKMLAEIRRKCKFSVVARCYSLISTMGNFNFRVQTAIVQQGRISLALPSPDQNESTADDVKLVNEIDDGDPQTDYKYIPNKALVR